MSNTHEEFQIKLSAIPNLELAEKGQLALSKLCKTGAKSFTMTVPPRLDDTDMVLGEIIKRFEILSLPQVPDRESELIEMLEHILAGRIRPREYASEWDKVNELIQSVKQPKI